MEELKLKNAIFYSDKIVLLKKQGNIIINNELIERIAYVKPTLLNYLLASIWFGGTFPGRLEIYLTQKVGKSKLYLIKIKYADVLKLPEFHVRKLTKT